MEHEPAKRTWKSLGEPLAGFDNTNGVVDLGEDESSTAPRGLDESDVLARGVASDAASIGFSGGF